MNFTSVLFHLDRKLSIFEETIIVAMEEDFHIGDVVCLKWDKTKRFCVSNKFGPDKIEVCYFSEKENGIAYCVILVEFLTLAPQQE